MMLKDKCEEHLCQLISGELQKYKVASHSLFQVILNHHVSMFDSKKGNF